MKKLYLNFIAGLLLLLAGQSTLAAATVTTDQPDYAPGSTATITGTGFAPGETVELQVLNLTDPTDIGAEHDPWLVAADADGNFTTTWYVTADEANMTLELTVIGLTSGLVAQVTFTDTANPTLATGGSAISADTTSAAGGTGAFTTLTGPVVTETDNAGMSTGSMILDAPAGFEFDTTANSVTVTVTGSGTLAFINTSNSTTGDSQSKTVTPTATTITIWVTVISPTGTGNRSTFTWSGIKVRPTGGTTTRGNITYSGTSTGVTAGTNMGTLTEVPGAIASYVVAASSPQSTATAFNTTVTAKDQFNNTATNNSSTVVTMIGTGSIQFDSNGDNTFGDITKTLASGAFTISTLDKVAETVTITATDANSKTGTSGNVVINTSTSTYRSQASGNWATAATWQVWNGSTWVTAGSAPSSASAIVTVQSGHNVTNAANVTVDQVVVAAGGQLTVNSGITLTINDGPGVDLDIAGTVNVIGTLTIGATADVEVDSGGLLKNSGTVTSTAATLTFNSGGTYQHNRNGGTIPTATWDANSTCLITGITTTAPSGVNQSFGNFTWNCASQSGSPSLNGALTTVRGNFTIASTGGGANYLSLDTSTGFILTISGDFIASGGNLDITTSPATSPTINLAGNYTQTAGTIGYGAGIATSFNFTGAGKTFTLSGGTFNTAQINLFVLNGASLTLNNNLPMVSGYTMTVNNGGTLYCGTYAASTIVTGTGNFAVASGGTLGIADPYGILTGTGTGATGGSIQVTGTRTYNAGANYIYNGTAAQAAGNGLTTANNLTITNSAGVTLSGATTVNGSLALASGALSIGPNTLTLNGDIADTGGSLTGGAAANITFGGAGASTALPAVTLNNLTVNRANGIALDPTVTVTATLALTSGQVTSAGNLMLGNGATISRATGSLDAVPTFGTTLNVIYTAGGVTTGPELPVSTTVLLNLSLNNASGTVTLNADATVNGTFTTTAGGTFADSGHTLTVEGNVTNGGTHTSSGSGEILLAGTSAQTLSGTGAYGNLELTNAAGASLGANTTISGKLTVTTGTFTAGAFNLSVAGATGVSGTLAITSTTGTKSFADVTVNNGGVWNNSANEAIAINGNLANSGTFTAGSGTYTLSGAAKTIAGTLAIPSLTVTGTYANSGTLTVATLLTVTSPGVLTNNGTVTATTALSGTGGLTQGANATLTLGGTSVITTLTATATGNTVNYNGAVQTVHGNNYYDLALSGSGAKTLPVGMTAITGDLTLSGTATATTVVGLTIGGNLNLGDGATFTAAGFALTVTGATTVGAGTSGNLTISSATGTKSFADVTVNNGGVWNNSANEAIAINGNLANSGTFTAGSGTYTLSGAAKTIAGTLAIPSLTVTGTYANSGTLTVATLLTVTSPGVLTNNGTVTATTALSGTGGLTQGANATLTLGGTSVITTLTATATGNTVNYNGIAQTVKAVTYDGLIFSGSGAKSMTTGTTVSGNLSIAPTGSATASVGTGLTLPVGSLTLGGIPVVPGTWGSTTATTATNHNDTYFAATTGKLNVSTGASALQLIVTLPGQTFVSGSGNSGTVSGQVAGTPFNITLSAVDALNAVDTNYSGSRTVSYTGPANAPDSTAPTYITTVTFTAGKASGLATTLVKAETPTITATISGLAGVASSSVYVAPGAATKLAFTAQPGGGTGGTAWTTQPVVTVQDSKGNTVTNNTSTVTVAIANNAGPGGILSGTLTKAAVAGVADFSANALKIDKIGTGYTLGATDGALTSATSSAFDITLGAMASYSVAATTTQPRGTAFNVTVEAIDAGGNTVTTDNSTVVTLTSSTGNMQFDSNGDSTFGDNTKTLVGGTFTISALDDYFETVTITATDAGAHTGTSSTITVNPLNGDFASRATGNWNANTTWSNFNGTAWVNAATAPTSSTTGQISVKGGFTVTVTASVTAQNLYIVAGSAAAINASQILTINNGLANGVIANGTAGGALAVTNGTLTLIGNNTYSGGTTIGSGGTVSVTNVAATGNQNLGSGGITFANGGTLLNTGTGAQSTAKAITLNSGGGVITMAGPTMTLTGNFTGSGGLTTGGSDLVLNRASGNNAIGPITVNSGRLFVYNTNSIGGSSIAAASGATVDFTVTGGAAPLNTMTFVSGSCLANRVGTLILNTANVTFPTSGTMIFNSDDQNTTAITISGTYPPLTGDLTVQVGPTGVSTVGNVTNSAAISGSYGLTKASTGRLVLNSANTYTGGTTVSAGTLEARVSGSLGTRDVSVASGAVLQLVTSTGMSSTARLLLDGASPSVTLNTVINQTVGGLSFDGGVTFQASGTWGASGKTHNDSRFTGSGTLTVSSPIALTVTAAANTKTYDGTTSAAATPTLTSGALAGGDTATYSETYSTKDVGTGNKTLTPAVIIKDSGNTDVTASYSISLVNTNTSTINAKPLTAVGNLVFPASKVYDGATTAPPTSGAAALLAAENTGTGNTGDGIPYSVDAVSLTGTAAYNYNTKDVATATTITESGLSLTGAGSGNYTLTPPSFSATITPATPTLVVISSSQTNGFRSSVNFTSTLPSFVTSGNVVFLADTVAFSTNAISLGEAYSLTITNLPRGTNVISALYAGDSNYLGSTNVLSGGQIITNHPPVIASNASYNRSANAIKVFTTQLLALATDADGDPLTVTGSSASTNSVTPLNAPGILLYINTNGVNDRFTYTVSDGYGGSATGTVYVDFNPFATGQNGTVVVTNGVAGLAFRGIPTYRYGIERSTNMVDWTLILTTNTPASGAFQYTDTFSDLGGPPASAFYRLHWNP